MARRQSKRHGGAAGPRRRGRTSEIPEQKYTHFHSKFLLSIAEKAARAEDTEGHGPPITIIFAVASVEALLWEIEYHYSTSATMWLADARAQGAPPEALSRLERCERVRRLFLNPAIQRSPFRERVQALAVLNECPDPDWSRPPLQDLVDLIALRNWIVHVRPENLEPYLTTSNRLIRALRSRKLLTPHGPHAQISLFAYLWEPKVTTWVLDTVKATRAYLVELFPDIEFLK